MNLILDDKAGFDPERHWAMLDRAIQEVPILTKEKKRFLVSSTIMRIQSPKGPHKGHMAV